MTDIRDLDISYIREFISINNKNYDKFLNLDDIYDIAFDLMHNKNTKYDKVHSSIIQWMRAYNALYKGLDITSYTASEIKKLDYDDFNQLAKLLEVTKVDDVIEVLRYMHKLKSELDFEINIDLYIPLLKVSNFKTILTLVESKPSLKDLIIELFYDILDYNSNIPNFYYETSDFIKGLIELKYYDIVEKLIPVIIEHNYDNYLYLIDAFAEKRFLNVYFKYFKEYNPIFRTAILKALSNKNVSHYYLMSKVIQFAVDEKDLDMLSSIVDKMIYFFGANHKYVFYGYPLELSNHERVNIGQLLRKARSLSERL
jgi:hypothetical protein